MLQATEVLRIIDPTPDKKDLFEINFSPLSNEIMKNRVFIILDAEGTLRTVFDTNNCDLSSFKYPVSIWMIEAPAKAKTLEGVLNKIITDISEIDKTQFEHLANKYFGWDGLFFKQQVERDEIYKKFRGEYIEATGYTFALELFELGLYQWVKGIGWLIDTWEGITDTGIKSKKSAYYIIYPNPSRP